MCNHYGKKGFRIKHCYQLKNEEKRNEKSEKVVEEVDDLVICPLTVDNKSKK